MAYAKRRSGRSSRKYSGGGKRKSFSVRPRSGRRAGGSSPREIRIVIEQGTAQAPVGSGILTTQGQAAVAPGPARAKF